MAAPLSGWATMRDCAIVDFLANRPKSEGPISKTDDKLFNKLRASFKHVGLDDSELPPYMNNLDNFHNCIKLFSNDTKGHLKTKVRTSFAAMQSMLQLCGFNATTVEDVFSAIGTIKRNADTTAAVSSSSAAVASSVIVAPISADASVQTDQHPSEASSTPASPAIAAAPAKTSHKWIPKPIPGTADIKSFFSRSPKTVAASTSELSTSAQPSQPPQSTSQPASESVSLAPAVVKTAVFKHQPRLRPGQIIKRVEDVTKLKNSVTTLRAEKRSLVSAAKRTAKLHRREIINLCAKHRHDLLYAQAGVLTNYSPDAIQREHVILKKALEDKTRQMALLQRRATLRMKSIVGKHGKLRSDFAALCRHLELECSVPLEKMSLALQYAWSAFFPGASFPCKLPSPNTWRTAMSDLGAADARKLALEINSNPNPVHFAADGSTRQQGGTTSILAIRCSQWDNETTQPVRACSRLSAPLHVLPWHSIGRYRSSSHSRLLPAAV
jgi:hypothetical protein